MNNLTEEQYDIIFEILENFDFDRVKKTMDVLNWQWAEDVTGTMGVPSLKHIKQQARKQLIRTAKETLNRESKECFIFSGGFFTECKLYEDGFFYCSLKFVLTEWDNSE